MKKRFEFQVTEKDAKKRLDEFLFGEITNISKIYLRDLIKEGQCEVNGALENRGYRVKKNDFIEIELEFKETTRIEPEEIQLEIVFEDAEILVVNKPSGMLVHPTVGVRQGTLLNALAFYLNRNVKKDDEISPFSPISASDFIRAGLVHRLDKQTSGLMVIAKNAHAHRILAGHFRRKLVEKRYFALVEGIVKENSGTIEAPIGRFEEARFWNIKTDGKPALSRFWVKERLDDKTLLELEPVTGRTNQLRIHLAHIGHSIIGDEKYGGRQFSRLCLHAYRLCFWHPNGNRRLEFETGDADFFGNN